MREGSGHDSGKTTRTMNRDEFMTWTRLREPSRALVPEPSRRLPRHAYGSIIQVVCPSRVLPSRRPCRAARCPASVRPTPPSASRHWRGLSRRRPPSPFRPSPSACVVVSLTRWLFYWLLTLCPPRREDRPHLPLPMPPSRPSSDFDFVFVTRDSSGRLSLESLHATRLRYGCATALSVQFV